MKKNGFTLIETMVVMIIIAIITAIVLVQYRSNEKSTLLHLAAQEVVNNLREVQNMALAAEKFNGAVPEGGYGGYFNIATPDSYIIFADVDADGLYDGAGEIVRVVYLPDQIEIYSLVTDLDARIRVSATFLPPSGKAFITDDEGSGRVGGGIGLRVKGDNETREITIIAAGVGTIEY